MHLFDRDNFSITVTNKYYHLSRLDYEKEKYKFLV